MQATRHSYNTGHYFSTGVRVFGWITTGLSLLMLLDGSVAAYLFLPAGFILHFTHYRTEFDLEHRTYREGVRLAGMTFGKMLPLPGFDFLFLKRNRYTQRVESRASMSYFEREKYDGYLKLSDATKLHLLQYQDKEKAMREMQRIAQDLQLDLRDLTEINA